MFITFEGVEGSGKSTQIALAESWLRGRGAAVTATRQPGGCPLGLELRRILLDARNTHLDPTAELFLYLADRAQHVAETIRPALERGGVVLCDRFHDSTVAYQGFGRGLDVERLIDLGRLATGGLDPDLTVVLDLDPCLGLNRAKDRNKAAGLCQDEGRFENLELAFHQRVRQGFLELAKREPARFLVADASGSPQEVFERLRQALEERMAAAPGA